MKLLIYELAATQRYLYDDERAIITVIIPETANLSRDSCCHLANKTALIQSAASPSESNITVSGFFILSRMRERHIMK